MMDLGWRGWARCFMGILWREALRFLRQRERFLSALVRPLVWLFIFAAGFRAALGLSATERIVAFVGRIQPLKAPDVLQRDLRHRPDIGLVFNIQQAFQHVHGINSPHREAWRSAPMASSKTRGDTLDLCNTVSTCRA